MATCVLFPHSVMISKLKLLRAMPLPMKTLLPKQACQTVLHNWMINCFRLYIPTLTTYVIVFTIHYSSRHRPSAPSSTTRCLILKRLSLDGSEKQKDSNIQGAKYLQIRPSSSSHPKPCTRLLKRFDL